MSDKPYIVGKDDYRLWGHVGRLIVDKKIHEKLGIAVTSDPDDIWWLALTHKKETRGFACARLQKNKKLHLRYFYHENENLGLKSLIMKAINYAKDNKLPMVYTNWHKDCELLPTLGFVAIPRQTGKFCRWELEIKGNENEL